jgi:methylated-DNA-protein-cysteine methyltransferase-like protein
MRGSMRKTRRSAGEHVEAVSRGRPSRSARPKRDATPPFYRLVYRVVRRIPRGRVVTYAQVAAILGQPRGARAVGMALGALRAGAVDDVPWQRVVGAAGRCTHRDGFWAGIQREMLEAEGVTFDRRGHLDLARVRWQGPRREWATRLRGQI